MGKSIPFFILGVMILGVLFSPLQVFGQASGDILDPDFDSNLPDFSSLNQKVLDSDFENPGVSGELKNPVNFDSLRELIAAILVPDFSSLNQKVSDSVYENPGVSGKLKNPVNFDSLRELIAAILVPDLSRLNQKVLDSDFENPGVSGKLKNPVNFDSLRELIAAILDVIVQIGVPIAAVFLIYSGYLFVSARGSEEKLGKAKSIFLWTLVGIAVLLGASVLANLISGTIDQLKR